MRAQQAQQRRFSLFCFDCEVRAPKTKLPQDNTVRVADVAGLRVPLLGEKRCEHRKNVVNTVDVFLVCKLELAVGLCKRRERTAARLPSLEYTHQPWSSPREEGLRSKWDEPRDPAASLADQTLRRRAAQTVHHRSPRWRGSQALEEKSSRASLATGPRPRRKSSHD